MAKIYHNKIKSGAINPRSGKPWEIDDVPDKWKAEVEMLLAAD